MIDLIKKIREQTGLSMADIKMALEEAGDDEEKTMAILRERGHKIAEKKSGRKAEEGIVDSYIHSTRKVGAIIVLNCETDFVAKSPDFLELAHALAMQVASMDPQDAEELMAQSYIREPGLTVRDLMNKYIAKLGENIKVGEFARFSI